ncbi:hypothetical protein RFI_04994 [Reticulomyxa filosa]|uniref:PUB domain-containing protein n=1 Tax=Reticulomyxa filosa TaxID=46433 RepID=X6P0N5_RETFI|nr:hypothetical protein RFI_04994 [Reticulomyxa filosa]|eukprot:ETO32125.1 hypothetical protein RFI_04994 [Reticulomyxa filosa]
MEQTKNAKLDIFKECMENVLIKENCAVDVKEGIEVLHVYVKNLIKSPDEEKYREICLTNLNFQVRLGHLKGSTKLLETIGFEYKSSKQDYMVLKGKIVIDLKKLNEYLESKLSEVDKELNASVQVENRIERNANCLG